MRRPTGKRSGLSRGLLAVWIISATVVCLGQGNGAGRYAAVQSVRFGPMVPGRSGARLSVVLPVNLSVSPALVARGFAIDALSDFSFTPTASAAGGKNMTAADIHIGIVDVTWAQGAAGAATVAQGFGYDPTGSIGLSPAALGGAAAGGATLADVLAPREVVRVDKIPVKAGAKVAGDLTVTLKLAVRGQYLTPGTFSGTLTLLIPE